MPYFYNVQDIIASFREYETYENSNDTLFFKFIFKKTNMTKKTKAKK